MAETSNLQVRDTSDTELRLPNSIKKSKLEITAYLVAIISMVILIFSFIFGSCYDINTQIDREITLINNVLWEFKSNNRTFSQILEMKEGYLIGKTVPDIRHSTIALDSIISIGSIKYRHITNNLLFMKRHYTSISQNLDYADHHVLTGSNVSKLMKDAMFSMKSFQNNLSIVNPQLNQYKQRLEEQSPLYCFYK